MHVTSTAAANPQYNVFIDGVMVEGLTSDCGIERKADSNEQTTPSLDGNSSLNGILIREGVERTRRAPYRTNTNGYKASIVDCIEVYLIYLRGIGLDFPARVVRKVS